MKNFWQNGKLTPFARRMLSLVLCLCLLASVVQNIAPKGISADETVSGSDVAVVTQSDAVSETDEVSCADSSESDVSEMDASNTDTTVSESDVLYSGEETTDYGEPQITMTTTKAIGTKVIFYVDTASGGEVYVDWGNGKCTSHTTGHIIGITEGSKIKIYSDDSVTVFDCGAEGRNTDIAMFEGYSFCEPSALDITNCTSLVELDCDCNSITMLDLTKNTALVDLDCDGINLKTLDLSKNTLLETLSVGGSEVEFLNLSNNIHLKGLGIWDTAISSIDLSANTALEGLNCRGTNITELDLSNNNELSGLDCSDCQLTTLDVSNKTKLGSLFCDRNQLTSINITNCVSLYDFTCTQNQLTTLDASTCTSADGIGIECTNNLLEEIKLPQNTNVILRCSNNNLTSLPLVEYGRLICSDNIIAFSGFPTVPTEYDVYSPQKNIPIVKFAETGEAIDLSSEYDIGGTITTYTWYNASDDSIVTPAISANGVFTFGNDLVGEKLYCTMTNDVFPDLTLTTTKVEIIAGNSETESDSDMTPDDTESDTDISPDDTESDTDITPDENKSDSDIDPTPDTEVKGESDSADPETGDNSNIALVTIICVSSFVLMAACVASGVIVFRKKRKAENK